MIYGINGGPDKPEIGVNVSIDVIEPAGFHFRNIRFADFAETMAPAIGPVGEAYASGFRVDADGLPKVVRIADARHLVDFDTDGALKYASARARDLIERFEPGIHQFEPVDFVDRKGAKVADMFVVFVCRRLDTVDREHTNMLLSPSFWRPARDVARRKPGLVPPGYDLDQPSRRVISERQVGGAHLWRDRHITDILFMSGELVDAFDAEGLTGLARVKQESVA
ncbi:imm11 family protein [Sphingomonas sp. LM7]|uniref:imm11 family protein n=1 Tax=Sphingomonas sp. LM7 TaxID=1938607 RepID=UPI000983F521|nr:DUF1629 domain-containing protein [Sphingomonas sp. LM7]AQR75173.1 hypothetical protein BXU08_17245 [Sphingomonas sp. LM7]